MNKVFVVAFWLAPVLLWDNPTFWLLWAGVFLSFSLWRMRRFAR